MPLHLGTKLYIVHASLGNFFQNFTTYWWYIYLGTYLGKLYIFHLIYSPSKYVMYEVASLKIQCHWYDWWLGPFNPHPTPFWPSRSIKAFWHSIHQNLELRGEFHVQSSGQNTIGFDVNLLSDQDHTESNLPSDQISKTRYGGRGRHTALASAQCVEMSYKTKKTFVAAVGFVPFLLLLARRKWGSSRPHGHPSRWWCELIFTAIIHADQRQFGNGVRKVLL